MNQFSSILFCQIRLLSSLWAKIQDKLHKKCSSFISANKISETSFNFNHLLNCKINNFKLIHKLCTFNMSHWMATHYPNGFFQFFFIFYHNPNYVNCHKESFMSIWFRAFIFVNQIECRRIALYILFSTCHRLIYGNK